MLEELQAVVDRAERSTTMAIIDCDLPQDAKSVAVEDVRRYFALGFDDLLASLASL